MLCEMHVCAHAFTDCDIYLQATDKDLAENGTVEYVLVGKDKFEIDLNDGKVYTTEDFTLNMNAARSYELSLEARDRGTPVRYALSTLCVSFTSSFTELVMMSGYLSKSPVICCNLFGPC